jgi:hypothetical protein
MGFKSLDNYEVGQAYFFFTKKLMYMKNKLILLILILGFFSLNAMAQNVLLLKKGKNPKNHLSYQVGDEFIYKSISNNYYVTDLIKEIHEDYIILNENILTLEQIKAIHISDKDQRNFTINNLSLLAFGAGALLITAEAVNSLYHDKNLSIDPSIAILSGAMITSGFIISKLKYKHFKINRKNKIQLITQ